jgi:hypothetical protein
MPKLRDKQPKVKRGAHAPRVSQRTPCPLQIFDARRVEAHPRWARSPNYFVGFRLAAAIYF